MIPETPSLGPRPSWISLWKTHIATMVFATIGILAVLTASSLLLYKLGVIEFNILRLLSDSDEAPIRVRNGSLDLELLSTTQKWTQAGTSGNWNISSSQRFKDAFDLVVAVRPGAACGGQSASGAEIIFTYSNDKKVRLQSIGRHTWVKPDTGVTLTWDSATPGKLSYITDGFLKSIETGNGTGGGVTPMCTFTAANQLDQIVVLNVP
jgi:hypothetical protein